MPTWSGILRELNELGEEHGKHAFDIVRRKYLVAAHKHTNRNVILYATKWIQQDPRVPQGHLSIVVEDLQGLMEVMHGLEGEQLDLILHSPGGTLEAAEAFLTYLRSKFENIRVIVPHMAMSAATLIACGADKIVLGKHSFLGPIDPQIILATELGSRMVPCQAILDQFERALSECQDIKKLGAWVPMLKQYGPDLLVQCENTVEMAQELAARWLGAYMFRGQKRGGSKATEIAAWLADHGQWKSHGRPISRDELQKKGLRIDLLEDDQDAQDAFLSVFHATTQTFEHTPAVKIIENHQGAAFIKQIQIVQLPTAAPSEEASGESNAPVIDHPQPEE